MKNPFTFPIGVSFVAAVALGLASGCKPKPTVSDLDAPTPTPPVARTETSETRTLQKQIDLYEQSPSVEQSARVDRAFAEIDGEIAELVEHVANKTGEDRAEAAAKLKNLRAYRDGEQSRYLIIQARSSRDGESAATVSPTPQRTTESTAERIGDEIEDTAEKVGDGIKDAADSVREAVTNP